ncbi:MAG: TonB-dependent SusC/RagA subfamily outer membrane receptor [Roseivirga sp.]|jgi:TonB-dependent SusC/RagA subfamily outer membrane receptor
MTLSRFLFSVLFIALNSVLIHARQEKFDFDKAWDVVTRLEVQGLPKSAVVKVDSIYAAAQASNSKEQIVKSILYQSKFILLLKEDAQSIVVAKLRDAISESSKPEINILHGVLAKLYLNYFQANRWQLIKRTKISNPSDDFLTWDSETLMDTITFHYEKSLDFDRENLLTPAYQYEILLTREDSGNDLQPYLFDILASEAIEFLIQNDHQRPQAGERFSFNDSRFFSNPALFVSLRIEHADSSSYFLKALRIYQRLSEIHRDDTDPAALISLSLERLSLVQQESLISNKDGFYLDALKALQVEYASNESSTLIDFKIAEQLNKLGGQYDPKGLGVYQFKKVEALAICERAITKFPESFGANQCRKLANIIKVNYASLTSEEYLLPKKPSKILLTYKNYDSLAISTYKVTAEEFSRFNKLSSDSLKTHFINKLKLNEQWKVKLKNEKDYQSHSTEVIFPAHDLGKYLIVVSELQRQGRFVAYDFLQVTNLAIVGTSENGNNTFLVINRNNGAPVANVDFHVFTEGQYNIRIDTTIKSNRNGEVTFPNTKNGYDRLTLELTKGKDNPIYQNNYLSGRRYYVSNQNNEDGYEAKLQFFTDRRIYRPGQKVFFKAILIKQKQQGSTVVANHRLGVILYDTNDEPLDSLSLMTNEFGSIAGTFTLPKSGITGKYHLEIDDESADSEFFFESDDEDYEPHYFSVEEYKRPKFEVIFDEIIEAYKINDSVFVKGNATAFAGSSISNAKVKYSVTRSVNYGNYRYSSYPRFPISNEVDIAEGETLTDQSGGFTIPFIALIDSTAPKLNKPTFNYSITATVIDLNGETHEANTRVKVAYHTYELSLMLPNKFDKHDAEQEVYAQAKSLNGKPQEIKGYLKIVKLLAPTKVKRPAPWGEPDYPGFDKTEHDMLFPHMPYQNEGSIENWAEGKTYFKDSVNSGFQNLINLGKVAEWPAGQYMAQFVAPDPSGETLEAQKFFELVDFKSNQVADNQLFLNTLDKDIYKPGEKVKFRYGTAAKDLVVTIWITKGDKVVQKISQRLSNEFQTLEIPVEDSDQGGFGISFFYAAYNSFYQESLEVNVPHIHPKLNLEVGTFRNKLQPGAEETWSFKVSGEMGEQVGAELLASMYDASLDQFRSNDWQFSPFLSNQFYSRGNFDSHGGFRSTSFRTMNYQLSPAIPQLYYPQLKWFGLDFNNPENGQQRYIRLLWWERNLRPLISTKKVQITEGYVEGIVLDEMGNPFPQISVFTTDNAQSTTTDLAGSFKIKAKYNEDVFIRVLGYKTFSFKVSDDNYYQIVMVPDITDLAEVVVVGYGIEREKKSLGYSVSAIEIPNEEEVEESLAYLLQGKVAGVAISDQSFLIRGNSSIQAGSEPLYVVDGVIMSLSDFKPEDVASLEVLNGASATALYGAAAVNGVILVTTKAGVQKQNELLAQVKIRQNLNETAFFFPQLRTNEKGEVSFNFTSPESLTQWNLQLLAHSKNLASALLKKKVVTQKELMVLPNLPRFFRESDTLYLSVKVASLSLDTLSGFGQLQLYDAESNVLLEDLILGGQGNRNFTLLPKGNSSIEWKLAIPEGLQAIRYKIVAATNDFSDGEESIIPVLPNRMMVQESVPLWVGSKSTNEFSLDKLKNNQSSTLTHHSLTLTMTTNPIWEAIQSLPYLIEYPYECAEQTFSRYFANSLGSFLIAENPSIQLAFQAWQKAGNLVSDLEKNPELKSILIEETPWLREAKNETEQKNRMSMLFESQRMQEGLQNALSKLAEMQMSSGGFPWFAGSNRESVYISQHILTGLARLKSITGSEKADEIIENGISYLNEIIEERYTSVLKRKNTDPNGMHIGFIEVQNLYARSLMDEEPATEILKAALDYYEQQAFGFWLQMDLQSQAMIALYAHTKGNKRVVKRIMKSLKERSLQSAELGIYWKSNQSGWSSWESPIETQALLIEAFSTITEDQKFVEGLKQWLLAQKRVSRWKSTKATTDAIFALISTEHSLEEMPYAMTVKVGDETVLSNTVKPENQEEGTGYFKKVWNTTEVKNEMANINIDNQNNTIAWGGLYWQYFEDLDKITSSNTNLSIEKELYSVAGTASNESLELITSASELALGELVRVRIVLRSDRSMEFIHLKDMRASGLEPTNVLSSYKWQDGLGYYESTRDAATHFFIEYLPKGTFVFEYDLRVNNKGEFSNGITSIENMYAPEFSAHSAGERIKVGK